MNATVVKLLERCRWAATVAALCLALVNADRDWVIAGCAVAIAFTVASVAVEIATRQRKTPYLLGVARCAVETCASTGTVITPGGDWSRDDRDRHFCPAHPAATSCLFCGQDKGDGLAICAICARGDRRETP